MVRVHRLFVGWCVVLAAAAISLAQDRPPDPKQAAVTPDEADADFKVQGEYTGELQTDEGKVKFGVQVIALGGGKFHAVAYRGGLPGDGWDRQERIEADGETMNGVTTFVGEKGSGLLADGKLTVKTPDGEVLGTLERTVRQSPTLGRKPPEKAVVLFDGKSADHFQGGRITEDGLLLPGATSKQTFQDCTLHLEFLLSYMPHARGQGRSNSGVYLQGRYEVQVLDSFGLQGKHNECGGIYSVKDPDINMCLPPLQWQTYDIDFTAARFDAEGKKTADARMTVRHNGVIVHENVAVDHATTAAPLKEGPEPGPIYIQDHGNPLRFRNIWVVPKS